VRDGEVNTGHGIPCEFEFYASVVLSKQGEEMKRIRAEFVISEPYEEFEILYGWVSPPLIWKPWVFWFEADDGRRFWLPGGAYLAFKWKKQISSRFGKSGDFRFAGICTLRKLE
jgi:hypothetical protein